MASKFKREFKNVVYNYSDAEAKVREATSNDPWGPSSAVMSELADYTFHVQAYSLVMGMLWKRLNDHGRNWRHVYKSLTVLEYLIKGGSDRVSQQCKDNMFSIQTLKDFQYVDKDGKDQGANVREKAKQLVALLKDDRKLKEERAKAHTARQRQQALGSDSPNLRSSPNPGKKVTFGSPEAASPTQANGNRVQPVEQARPGNLSEEEMQLKLALQLSKQQADEEDNIRRQEEESLSAALALSAAENKKEEDSDSKEATPPSSSDLLLDLDTSIKDPWAAPSSEPLPTYDSIVKPTTADPWSVGGAPINPPVAMGMNSDPWAGGGGATTINPLAQPVPTVDPWLPSLPATNHPPPPPAAQNNPFDLSDLGLPPSTGATQQPLPKIEAQFLGNNANLVDLDLLTIALPKPHPISSGPSPANPFGLSSSPSPNTSLTGPKPVGNPFDNKAPSPSLSQLATTTDFGDLDPLQAPLVPVGAPPPVAVGNTMYPSLAQSTAGNQTFNPFS